MWLGLSNCLAHILPLISPTSHQHAYPGSNRLLNEALATQAVLGGVVEVNGAATITPGPKFPSLAKRQGTSFIGYIASGASWDPRYCSSGTYTLAGNFGGCCTASCTIFYTQCAGASALINQGGVTGTCSAGKQCVTDYWYRTSGGPLGATWVVCDTSSKIYYATLPSSGTTSSSSVTPPPGPSTSTPPVVVVLPTSTTTIPAPAGPSTTTKANKTPVGGGGNTQPPSPVTITVVASSTAFITSGNSVIPTVVVYTSTSVNVNAVQNTLSPGSSDSGSSPKSNKSAIIGGAAGGGAFLLLVAVAGLLVCLRLRKKRRNAALATASGLPGSPAPILYSEPSPSHVPSPPHMAYASNVSPVGAPAGGYFQSQQPQRWSQSPSELSSEESASPPPRAYGYNPQQQSSWQGQPSQGYTSSNPSTYGGQGFQAGRRDWGSVGTNTGLAPISELGSRTPGPLAPAEPYSRY